MIRKNKNKIRKSAGDYVLDTFVYTVLAVFAVICFYPFWYVIVASFSSGTHIIKNPGLLLWPDGFHLNSYILAFKHPRILSGFANALKILLISLPINIVLTLMCGYFMARRNMGLKKIFVGMMLFTMYFDGGLIPAYLNIKDLGLYNSHWALILGGALSVYNAIICKTAIESLPESLLESARLDGANELQVLFKIIMPLIKPTIAVLILYYGVAKWNSWFAASIYLESVDLLPIQNILRDILNKAGQMSDTAGDSYDSYAEAVKYSAVVITTLPIMCVYPFLQKHFTKGVMIGAVKG